MNSKGFRLISALFVGLMLTGMMFYKSTLVTKAQGGCDLSGPYPTPTPVPTPEINFSSLSSYNLEYDASTAPCFTIVQVGAGQDLGAAINQADAALCSGGSIEVWGGGEIMTQAIVGHHIHFDSYTYYCSTQTGEGCILLKDGVLAEGSSTIIYEPTFIDLDGHPAITVFQSYADAASPPAQAHTGLSQNIGVEGFIFWGRQTRSDGGVRSTVNLGNCHWCGVMNNYLIYTSSIGIQFGGSSETGNFADNVLVYNNQFLTLPAANIALVNADHALVIGNIGSAPGFARGPSGGGNSGIDIEPNSPLDHAAFIGLYNNQFDYSGAAAYGSAILVQNPYQSSLVHDITVANNRALDGCPNLTTNHRLSAGVQTGRPIGNLFVANNYVTIATQDCLAIYGDGGVFQDNQCISTGGGGNFAVYLKAVHGVQLLRNLIWDAPNTQTSTGPFIYEDPDSSGNIFSGNTVCVIHDPLYQTCEPPRP